MAMSRRFAGAAAAACVAITVASPLLTQLASGGEISIGLPLLVAFSALMIVQAAKYPLGIFLTDAPGLRFQAFMIVAIAPCTLAVSVVLGARLGAVGPVIGSIAGVLVFEPGANLVYVRCVVRRRPARGGSAGDVAALGRR